MDTLHVAPVPRAAVAQAREDHQAPPGTRPRLVLALTSIGVFMVTLDSLAVNNALPRMAWDLGVGIARLQWVAAVYTLAVAAFVLSASVLGRRLGHANAFLLGIAVFITGSIVCALAPSWAVVVAGRATQGLGGALLMPTSSGVLRAVFPDNRDRAKASGVRGAAGGLGYALGPVVGGTVLGWFGWRSVMWINVPVGLAVLVVGMRVLPRTPGSRVRWDPFGQVLAALGLSSLIYALVQGPVDGWTCGTVLAAIVVSATALPTFVLVEARTTDPMLDLKLFRDRTFSTAALVCFVTSAGLTGSIFLFSLYLQEILHWSPGGAGRAFLPGSLFIILSAPAAATVSARRGPFRPMLLGVILCPVVMAGLSFYGVGASYRAYGWLFPAIGACVGLTVIPVSIVASRRVAARHAGVASAVVDMVEECGGVMGVAVLGAIVTTRLGGNLMTRAVEAGVPAPQARSLVHAVLSGGPERSMAGGSNLPPPVRAWVEQSFLDGMHFALRCGAMALAYAVVLLLLFPPRDSSRQRATDA